MEIKRVSKTDVIYKYPEDYKVSKNIKEEIKSWDKKQTCIPVYCEDPTQEQ